MILSNTNSSKCVSCLRYRPSHFFAFLGSGAAGMTGISFDGSSQRLTWRQSVSHSSFVLVGAENLHDF